MPKAGVNEKGRSEGQWRCRGVGQLSAMSVWTEQCVCVSVFWEERNVWTSMQHESANVCVGTSMSVRMCGCLEFEYIAETRIPCVCVQ